VNINELLANENLEHSDSGLQRTSVNIQRWYRDKACIRNDSR